MVVEVRRIRSDEFEIVKQVRLAALLDSPMAFGSTYEREAGWDDDQWKERAIGSASGGLRTIFVAEGSGSVVGTAGGFRTDADARIELVSMWVAPTARGASVGKLLVEAVCDRVSEVDAPGVVLWVVSDNTNARHLYEAMGFALTGESQSHPNYSNLIEIEMAWEPLPR